MKQIIVSFVLLLMSTFAIADQYRVELCVFEKEVSSNYFHGISDVKLTIDINSLYRYYIGDFEDKATAEAMLKTVAGKGCKYARVVNYTAEKLACANSCSPSEGIQHIFFDFDQYTLRAKSQLELDRITSYLFNNTNHMVRLSGHTDSRGTEQYNITLANNRANKAKTYLLTNGVEEERILVKEFGESNPIAKNRYFGADSPMGRQFNRRVMFAILDQEGNEIEGIIEPISIPELLRATPFNNTEALLTMVL